MKKVQLSNQRKILVNVAGLTLFAFAGLASAADAPAFDVKAFLDPVVAALTTNIPIIITSVAGVFALVWGATTGISIVKRFLSKATS